MKYYDKCVKCGEFVKEFTTCQECGSPIYEQCANTQRVKILCDICYEKKMRICNCKPSDRKPYAEIEYTHDGEEILNITCKQCGYNILLSTLGLE